MPEQQKNLCWTALTARVEALANPKNEEEYREAGECRFLANALSNGWLVSDINMLQSVYNSVQSIPEGEYKTRGNKILSQFAGRKTNTLLDRFELMEIANNYMAQISYEYPEVKEARVATNSHHNNGVIFPSEYPNDKDFQATAGKDNIEDGISFGEINKNAQRYNDLKRKWEARARTGSDYVFDELSDEEREAEKQKPFVPNDAQRFNDITKTTRQAVTEVVGDDIYDEIEEMSRGSFEDRKVPLHHSLGTKYMQQGHHVLEMDFAGSSGKDVYKPYKGHNGGIDKSGFTSPSEADEFYGKVAQDRNGVNFKYIHYKESELELPDKSKANKIRYSIAGPAPDWWKISGIPNLGAYSIENTREYGRFFAEKFLEPYFDKWRQGGERKPIHIELAGHSRGAVAAAQTCKRIDAWISKYIKEHQPEAEDFKKYIHYDLTLRDPVPGMITDLHLGSCTLKGIPNVNTTVFYTLGVQKADLAFPPQHIRGAKRLILTTDVHQMDLEEQDESQQHIVGGGKKHGAAYYDPETGEMHRGSGINELPDGIYVADEKRNLIRLTSYSQVNDLFGSVYDKSNPQRIRARRIHKMVRDWFLENSLEMSFPDERTRKTETTKNLYNQNRILRSSNKRLNPVKEAINQLQELKKKNPTKEALIEQNKKLIEACRAYMKDTTMPPSGNSAYRAGLVSDTLSFTMRENNQLTKELSIEKKENRTFELDDKIQAQKKRLEMKPGYLERKQAAESKRLVQEQKVLELIKDTSKRCSQSLKDLNNTRIGKTGSTSYEQLHKVLEIGSKMGEQTSVRDMTEFLKLFNTVSDNYTRSHNALIGPFSEDGKKRLMESQDLNIYGKKTTDMLNELTKVMGDKNTPIGVKIQDRQENLDYLKQRQQELFAPEKQPEVKPAEQSAQPVMSL